MPSKKVIVSSKKVIVKGGLPSKKVIVSSKKVIVKMFSWNINTQ